MEKPAEQVYTDRLRQLASSRDIEPGVVADMFSDVERMHSIGQITDWPIENAREAYASTVSAAGSKVGDAANWAMAATANTGVVQAGGMCQPVHARRELDAQARQPQSGEAQDYITQERRKARNRQHQLRC